MAETQNLYALLDQSSWIHALARRLVKDPNQADDLVQETWMDALEQRPDPTRPLRGWLATVMRNNLIKLRRGDANRSAREQRVSREERAPSTLDVVEKAATHRDLVMAVLALEEPYRKTVLMRFFEQLSYGQIAQRMGVTRACVNSRITRGLERLRQRLETTYGDRRAFHLALLPLAMRPAGVAKTTLGLKIMNVAIASAAVTLVTMTVSLGLSSADGNTARDLDVLAAVPVTMQSEGRPQVQLPDDPNPAIALAPAAAEKAQRTPVQERRQRKEIEEKDIWKTDVYQTRFLEKSVKSLMVNATSGDIEIRSARGLNLEIDARVRARIGKVKDADLTQIFEDHVKLTEENGVLKIEDNHKGQRGWSVSFVVRVPGDLPLAANTGSGDVLIQRAKGKVTANTGSGDVELKLSEQKIETVRMNTGSGDVIIDVSSVSGALLANTGSGDIVARMRDTTSPGKANFNTGSGDIRLTVPAGIIANFDLETDNGDISFDSGLKLQIEDEREGVLRARTTNGIDGGTFRLRTGSGDLELVLPDTAATKPL